MKLSGSEIIIESLKKEGVEYTTISITYVCFNIYYFFFLDIFL